MLFYFTADHKRVVFFLILFICLFFLFLTTFPRYPTERSELDFREELADGFTCAMNRYKREERQGRDTVQCLSEISHDDIVQELVHESHYSICTFKNLETTAASLEDEGTEVDPPPDLQSNAQPQEGPAEGLMPGPARGPTLALPGLKLYLKPGWRCLFWAFYLVLLEVLNFILNI
nr:uncharacterized protein LOC123480062 isoform X1 [Desmodus rotundus]